MPGAIPTGKLFSGYWWLYVTIPHLMSRVEAHCSIVVGGRFCSGAGAVICCLPCPQTEWLYPDNFDTITKSTNWINVVGMVCTVFLLVSFAFLPVNMTHRHYLSVCLAI